MDLVARYAVHRQAVSFFCRKHGDASAAISVAVTASPIDRIRQIHGSAAANELTPLTASDADYGYTLGGFTSTANYHAKRITFLLFINHRSVESTPIRKAVDQVYHHFLPKGQHPFVYIDLSIDPKRVDVNVHPTKREVRFLHEDEIIEQISDAIRAVLATDDSARTFMTQSLLRDAPSAGERGFVAASKIPIDDPLSTTSLRTPAKVYENNLVRTDPRSRKITSMLPQASRPSPTPNPNATGTTPNTSPWDPPPSVTSKMTYTHDPTRVATPCRLTSIRALRSEVRDAVHGELTQLFMAHTFVGVVCAARRLAAVQAGVKLYLVDYGLVAAGYFYQLGLTDFGNFGTIRFEPPLDLGELLRGAARHEGWLEAEARKQRLLAGGEEEEEEEEERGGGFDWDAAAEQVLARLVGRREMLAEYFNLQVSAEGELGAIPLLLRDYRPCLGKLPRFLLRLGPCVDWTAEKECFGSFLRELAAFYAPEALPVEGGGEGSREAEGEAEERLKARRAEVEHVVEHALFPAFKARLVATKAMVKAVVEVADLKGLYRVFERC